MCFFVQAPANWARAHLGPGLFGPRPVWAIVSIILIESILITTLAGYLGLLAGVGILEWASPVLKTYFITDPSVSKSLVISATLTLIGAGTLAGYLPAQKASKIKPIVALRDD